MKITWGNVSEIAQGEFKLMSSGAGITHSEINPSETESLEFLHIWIKPALLAVAPRY